jgi:hypothetical protein
LDGVCSPHYAERVLDYHATFLKHGFEFGYGIENDCALEFTDGVLTKVLSSGGKAYKLFIKDGEVCRTEIVNE